MRRISKDLGRVERRKVRAERVVCILKSRPCCVNDECSKTEEHQKRGRPPCIPARRLTKTSVFPDKIGSCHTASASASIMELCSAEPGRELYHGEFANPLSRMLPRPS